MSYRRTLTPEGLTLRVSQNVRRLRFSSGLTAKEAASQGGMGLRYLQKVEAGDANLTLKTMAKLCAALHVDAVELFRAPPRDAGSLNKT